MPTENDSSIKKWVEENSSVSAVAADLALSRPTIYKYMEKYDNGDCDKLPGDVVAYFQQKLTPKDDPELNRRKAILRDESSKLKKKLEIENVRMNELIAKRTHVMFEMDFVEKSDKEDTDKQEKLKNLQLELEVLSKESLVCSKSVNDIMGLLEETENNIAELERIKQIPSDTKQFFNIKSSCFIENGRCMIVHTGEKTTTITVDEHPEQVPVFYRLHLYAKIGNEFAHLGDYQPVKNRNFFIIDDVFLSAPLYYNIVACVEDQLFADNEDEFKRPEGEQNLIELSGSDSTGMCELKQKR